AGPAAPSRRERRPRVQSGPLRIWANWPRARGSDVQTVQVLYRAAGLEHQGRGGAGSLGHSARGARLRTGGASKADPHEGGAKEGPGEGARDDDEALARAFAQASVAVAAASAGAGGPHRGGDRSASDGGAGEWISRGDRQQEAVGDRPGRFRSADGVGTAARVGRPLGGQRWRGPCRAWHILPS